MAFATAVVRSFAVAALVLLAVHAAPQANRITNMPNFNGSVPFAQYSGYITVNQQAGRALFYWFVESQGNPSTDPVILWLNGGPGCSSLDGFFYEHGPFHFDRDVSESYYTEELHSHRYAWNKYASMIYLESPAGVGFSYANNSDYSTNDNQTTYDSWEFLVGWFKEYPEFASRDFYVAGESYAGIYVPLLSAFIHGQNSKGLSNINLKGIMVGNGVTASYGGSRASAAFFAGHAILANQSYWDMHAWNCFEGHNRTSSGCRQLEEEMISNSIGFNEYDVYMPCYRGPKHNKQDFYKPLRSKLHVPNAGSAPACVNSWAATNYLNNASVRQAIHAMPRSEIGDWMICSDKVRYHEQYSTVFPEYEILLENNYSVLIYSGDADTVVPWTYTSLWLNEFTKGSPAPKVDFKPWWGWTANWQIVGMATVWEKPAGLMWATIKGSGHMVPQYAPAAALSMFGQFLNKTFPQLSRPRSSVGQPAVQ